MSTIGFYSTRDPSKQLVSFKEALLKGLALDGGLFVPNELPPLAVNWEEAASLAELGKLVFRPFMADDIADDELAPLLADALSFDLPLHDLGDGVFVLELFHGPTLSFKDFGARTMARLMNHFLRQRQQRLTILVATSGDTGSAVADGFAGMDAIHVILLYPKGLVSDVQERQLIVKRPGVKAVAVEGSFDDCQRLVKAAFTAEDLASYALSSANSINIGRLLPQMLYYLWARKTLAQDHGIDNSLICVPSGNLGNFSAGFMAKEMGMPVAGFLLAHNANHFFPEYLAARKEAYDFAATQATLSNAMDVGAPSNFERLHHLFGDDKLRGELWAQSVDDDSTLARMQRLAQDKGYHACPHTAVGLEAVARYRQTTADNRPVISLATAHPVKFPDAFTKAGIEIEGGVLEHLFQQETDVELIPPDITRFKTLVQSHAHPRTM